MKKIFPFAKCWHTCEEMASGGKQNITKVYFLLIEVIFHWMCYLLTYILMKVGHFCFHLFVGSDGSGWHPLTLNEVTYQCRLCFKSVLSKTDITLRHAFLSLSNSQACITNLYTSKICSFSIFWLNIRIQY